MKFVSYFISLTMFILAIFMESLISTGRVISTCMVLVTIMMFTIYPIKNIYSKKRKYIKNNIYHLISNGLLLYFIFLLVKGIVVFYTLGSNELQYFFSDHVLILLGILIINYVFSLFFKKIIYESSDNFKSVYFLLSYIGICSLFSDADNIINTISLAIAIILPLALVIKSSNLFIKSEFQNLYFILVLIYIYNINIMGLILITGLYFKLDKYATNL